MNEQVFSTRQSIAVVSLFLIGSAVIFQAGGDARQDIWMSVLLALILALPLALLYARLMQVFPGRNLFDLEIDLFGQVFGRITVLIYTWFALHLGSLVIKNFTDFIQITSMDQTPQYFTAVCIGLLCFWCVRAGINTLGRFSAMALPIYLIITAGMVLLSINLWKFRYLTPVLYEGFKPVGSGAIDILALPFEEAILLPFILQPLKQNKMAKKIFIFGFCISAAVFLVVFTRNIIVLSAKLSDMVNFPSYVVISIIDIADFLQRMEVIMAILFFMAGFVKITVCMYVASLGLTKLFGLGDYKIFSAPMGALMISMSLFAYPNLIFEASFASRIVKYYKFPFCVLLPVIIWLCAEWRYKKLKEKGQLPVPPTTEEETPITRQVKNNK